MSTTSTRHSLIERIRDHHDEQAWGDFVAIYAPLIYSYGLKRRLQESDAADLTQDVLQIVLGAIDRYTHRSDSGSFRGWLFTVTLNCIRRKHVVAQRQVAGSGRTTIANALQDQPRSEQQEWNTEVQLRLFQWAAEQVRGEFQDNTWQAFWQTSVEGRKPVDVAAQLEMSLGSVYVAKSRIIARIREMVANAEQGDGSSS